MNKVLKNILTITIILMSIIALSSGLYNVVAVSKGDAVDVADLWSKAKIDNKEWNDVYCTQHNVALGHDYKVDSIVTIDSSSGGNKKEELKYAYVLSQSDTVWTDNKIKSKFENAGITEDGHKNIATYAIHITTSKIQNAIWEISNNKTPWDDGDYALFAWTVNNEGDKHYFKVYKSGTKYKVKQITAGEDEATGDLTESNPPKDVYGTYDFSGLSFERADIKQLVKDAEEFANNASETALEDITTGTPTVDYTSNNSYIFIGPYKIEYSNVTLNSIKVTDNSNNNVTSKVELTSSKNPTKTISMPKSNDAFYLMINKNDIPNGIKNIEFSGTQEALKGKLYFLKANEEEESHQSLVAGETKLENKSVELTVPVEKDLVPPIQIVLNKVDSSGETVNGPKFKVEYSNGLSGETKTVSNGSITFAQRTPSDVNTFTATITETETSLGYKLLSAPIVLEFTYSSGKWNVTKKSGPEENVSITTDTQTGITKITMSVENKAIIEKITVLKTNAQNSNTKLQGAKFRITLTNIESVEGYSATATDNKIILSDVTTNSNGNFVLQDLVIKDLSKNITIEIEETQAPPGCKLIVGTITVTLKRSGNSYTIHNASKDTTVLDSEFLAGNVTVTNHEIALNIKNIPLLQGLNLTKTDVDNNKLAGAKFEITLENVKSVNGQNATNGKKTITTVTDANGKFVDEIKNIEILNGNNPIIVKIKETEAPIGYKKLNGTIQFKINLNKTNGTYSIGDVTIPSTILAREFVSENLKLENNEIVLNIKDIPVMNLGGIVWEDTKTGDKVISGPDGKYNNEEKGIAGIEIKLYKGSQQITTDIYGKTLVTKTAGTTDEQGNNITNPVSRVIYDLYNGSTDTINLAQGEYIFPNLEKGQDYYVEFTYDGINYKTVSISQDCYTNNNESKVTEIGRTEFNNKFATISKGAANGGDSLEYIYDSEAKVSSLVTKQGSTVLEKYKMKAKSVNYLESASDWGNTWTSDGKVNRNCYALDINCGLTYKFFDLALGTDVKEAKVSINDKTTTYSYAEILNGALEDLDLDGRVQNNSATNGAIYNLYLYESDYTYRIEKYRTDAAIQNNINSEDASHITANENSELELEVTYTVMLKNQTKHEAKVEEFVYYYDEIYTPKNINSTDNYNVSIDTANRKITFTSKGAGLNVSGNDYRYVIDLTFTVNKNNEGYIITKENCTNVAEITKYSTTEGGLIDYDSAPGNGITNATITQYEDDTDQAAGINISVKEGATRIIAGTVWDDGKFNDANGTMNDSESKVNDVIVQLIEIKNVSGFGYCEYIWQETRSGSNKVKKLSEDGNSIQEITYGEDVVINNGEYVFTDFIPGNYIIRYIYGDGTTYETTANIQKYNGQDYQSTKDSNYKKSWYNTAGYTAGQSVARDNEARRLEVMAYSTIIDKDKGSALETKTNEMLENTWMAAETSRINVPVDTDNKSTESSSTTATNPAQGLTFDNMNFGLALRPETKLVLEKHITSLKIRPNGVQVQSIVEARAKINEILNESGTNIELEGLTSGLTTIKSERGERGFWKVETDVEELTQGAALEVEYTYVIKNESDENYLSSTLVNGYKDNPYGYAEYLTDLKNSVKGIMRTGQYSYSNSNAIGGYLGEFYYIGDKGTSDVAVLARAETLKESLNEEFGKQENVGDYFEARDFTSSDVKTYIDKDGNFVEEGKEILTVLESKDPTNFLVTKFVTESDDEYTENDTDWSKTAKVTTVLAAMSSDEIGGNYPSYIAEITKYSNAAGRRNMQAEPENLSYVHSEDTTITMNSGNNEDDEFWGESIIISKPTGEDKTAGVQIVIIATISLAILGAGIVLIKKFVLKK